VTAALKPGFERRGALRKPLHERRRNRLTIRSDKLAPIFFSARELALVIKKPMLEARSDL